MEPMLGQIMMFAGNFAPRGWALCDGQLLPISQHTALFSILGTQYGGDGRTTFGLPDFRGRVPMHAGNGPGLSSRRIGEKGGVEEVVLNATQIPSHNHGVQMKVNSTDSTQSQATNGASIGTPGAVDGRAFAGTLGYNGSTPDVTLNAGSVAQNNVGGNLGHTNVQPFQATYYIIALEGVFPSRS